MMTMKIHNLCPHISEHDVNDHPINLTWTTRAHQRNLSEKPDFSLTLL